jgi:Spx/MgsR family transcriptional regulator
MKIAMYGIPNCSTVKKARAWLDEHQLSYTFHDYKKQGVNDTLLQRWFAQAPHDALINRRGTTWRKLSESQQTAAQTAAGAVAVIREHPSVIKRPIVEIDDQITLIGFAAADYSACFAR